MGVCICCCGHRGVYPRLCGEDLSGFVKMQDVFQICQFVQWDGVVRVLSMGIPEVLGDIVHFDE